MKGYEKSVQRVVCDVLLCLWENNNNDDDDDTDNDNDNDDENDDDDNEKKRALYISPL